MPLVKDMETMNFLVSGSIGSGKTNLMHNLLPQVNLRAEAAVIIDNTGEMIAKYYDPDRGDIIFNPFDGRSKIGISGMIYINRKTLKNLLRF